MTITDILVTLLGASNAGLLFWTVAFIRKAELGLDAIPTIKQRLGDLVDRVEDLKSKVDPLSVGIHGLNLAVKNQTAIAVENRAEMKSQIKELSEKAADIQTKIALLERFGSVKVKP